MRVKITSTMLSSNISEEHELADIDEDELNDICDNLESNYGPHAEFRISGDDDSQVDWIVEQLSSRNQTEPLELLKTLHAAVNNQDGFNAAEAVMFVDFVVNYGCIPGDIVSCFDCEEYEIWEGSELDEVYETVGREKYDGPDEYEDYMNFEDYGRDRIENTIVGPDGCWYAYNTW